MKLPTTKQVIGDMLATLEKRRIELEVQQRFLMQKVVVEGKKSYSLELGKTQAELENYEGRGKDFIDYLNYLLKEGTIV